MTPRLDIIVVNRNSGSGLRETVGSVPAAVTLTFQLGRVVVVDNGSRDGSADNLEVVNIDLLVLRNAEHKGFAASCNQGTAGSGADYLLFLEPGTILNATSLAPCIAFLEVGRSRKVGIVGPQLRDQQGEIVRGSKRALTAGLVLTQSLGLDRLLPGLFKSRRMREWDHLATRSVQEVAAPFVMIRRDVFDQLGGFDERFAGYLEHEDLCLRAREAGYKIVHLASATARHGNEKDEMPVERWRLARRWQSRLHYAEQHFGPAGRLTAKAATFLVEPVALTLRALFRGSPEEAEEVWNGTKMLWRQAPKGRGRYRRRIA